MWWYIIALGCLHLQATTSTAGAQPIPGGWGMPPPRSGYTDASASDPDDVFRMQRFTLLQDSIPDNPLDSDPINPDPASLDDTPLLYQPGTKRAFTLLSRWHPFSTLSRNAPSIREQNRQMLQDLDIETRAMMRPVGQPLRWG